MKSKMFGKIFVFVSFLTFVSCSEFLLVPITVNYPFDENNPASPSEYEINIDDGLILLDKVMSEKVSASVVKNKIEKEYTQKHPGSQVSVKANDSELTLDDILDIITGKTVTKKIEYEVTVSHPDLDDIVEEDTFNQEVSICDFYDGDAGIDPVFDDIGIKMTIKNVSLFCKLSGKEKEDNMKKCSKPDRDACLHVEARHENTSMSIMLDEVEDLKSYKKFLNKIYSATLNDITLTILKKPDVNAKSDEEGSFSFVLESELYAQPVSSFDKNGAKCESSSTPGCTVKGVDYEGNPEDYFDDNPDTKQKYLVGIFGTNTFGEGETLDLLYTYEGKDILQKSIKHLNFRIGAKSFYLFFPGAVRPRGQLVADIKAKLLFNVEPL
ncbi:MAG: hypothetical protein ACOX2F_01845 [bacterium]